MEKLTVQPGGVTAEMLDAMVREGRDVMKKNLKAHFDEDVKFWTREDEAKAKCKALPLDTLNALAGTRPPPRYTAAQVANLVGRWPV